MLLLLLSCANGDAQDSVVQPDLQDTPGQWREAELRCNGSEVNLSAWTTAAGSAAQLSAVATPENVLPIEVTASMDLVSQNPSTGAQYWTYSDLPTDYACLDLRLWELRLVDAWGEQIDCIAQSGDPC